MEEESVPQSLVEQILQATFSALADREEFDAHTVQQLQSLTVPGDLTKPTKVAKVLKSMPGSPQ